MDIRIPDLQIDLSAALPTERATFATSGGLRTVALEFPMPFATDELEQLVTTAASRVGFQDFVKLDFEWSLFDSGDSERPGYRGLMGATGIIETRRDGLESGPVMTLALQFGTFDAPAGQYTLQYIVGQSLIDLMRK